MITVDENEYFTVDRGHLHTATDRDGRTPGRRRADAIVCTTLLCVVVGTFGPAAYFAGGGR